MSALDGASCLDSAAGRYAAPALLLCPTIGSGCILTCNPDEMLQHSLHAGNNMDEKANIWMPQLTNSLS
jgi:hypothetical protein